MVPSASSLLCFLLVLARCAVYGYYEEPGLYDDVREVAYLDSNNFNNVIINSGRAWLIQFYNSWCGHCIDFSPTYQEFARNVSGWRSLVAIGAINCADEQNIQVCRANKIDAYPTMKVAPPNATSPADLIKVTVKARTTKLLIEMLLKYLITIPYHLPMLQPIRDMDYMWEQLAAEDTVLMEKYAVFLLQEGQDSFVGQQIIMDTVAGRGLLVYRLVTDDTSFIQIQQVDAALKRLTVVTKNLSSYEEVSALLHPYLMLTSSSSEYFITRKPLTTAPPKQLALADKTRPFTNEEIEEQLAVVRAKQSRSNESISPLPNDDKGVVPSGISASLAEYREALLLAWQKRVGLMVHHALPWSSAELTTATATTTTTITATTAAAAANVVHEIHLSAGLPSSQSREKVHLGDVIMPKRDAIDPVQLPTTYGSLWAPQLDAVQLSDLLFAVRKSLGYELPLRMQDGNSTHLAAAKQYVSVLAEFLPCPGFYRSALQCLDYRLRSVPTITSAQWTSLFEDCQLPKLLERDSALASCKGSSVRYRGYPCTMWTLFHTLTVSEADVLSLPKSPHILHQSPPRPRVLIAMRDYIRTFFGCTECAHNFYAMAVLMNLTSVATADESILWLWTAHNKANARLSGARSEDPEHKKHQYPALDLCLTCARPAGNNGTRLWNVDNVLLYLKAHYAWSSIVTQPGLTVDRPSLNAVTNLTTFPDTSSRSRAASLDRPILARAAVLAESISTATTTGGRNTMASKLGDSISDNALAHDIKVTKNSGNLEPQGKMRDTEKPAGEGLPVLSEQQRSLQSLRQQRISARKQHNSAYLPSTALYQLAGLPAGKDSAGRRRSPRTHSVHKRETEGSGSAMNHFFQSFSSSDLIFIALLYAVCALFIAIFYYYFVVSKGMRIRLL